MSVRDRIHNECFRLKGVELIKKREFLSLVLACPLVVISPRIESACPSQGCVLYLADAVNAVRPGQRRRFMLGMRLYINFGGGSADKAR